MNVKPIIFSGPMVKALLAGTKTQTRRLVRPQPPSDVVRHCWFHAPIYGFTADADITTKWHTARLLAQEGDLLWVREAVCADEHPDEDIIGVRYIADDHFGPLAGTEADLEQHFILRCYRSTDPDLDAYKPVPSIHMPRWASRLTLEATDVRVQRLQDISEEDARAEGVARNPVQQDTWIDYPEHTSAAGWETARESFCSLWNSLHGKGAWDQNPWVAAYTFSVHHCNVDDLVRQREAA